MRRDYQAFEPSITAVLIWLFYYVVLIIPWMLGKLFLSFCLKPFVSESGRDS